MTKRILRQDSLTEKGIGAEQKCMDWQQKQLTEAFEKKSTDRCAFIFKQFDGECTVTLLLFKDSADMIDELHFIEKDSQEDVDFRHQD